jgi:hypothetical protein
MLYRKIRVLFWILLTDLPATTVFSIYDRQGYKKRPSLAGRPSTF